MPILEDIDGNKYMEASVGTRLHCVKRSCAWNDNGACFFKGLIKIGMECKEYTINKPNPAQPKDYENPACSSGIRCLVTAYFFAKDALEITKKMADYQRKWPREGYGTVIHISPRTHSKDGYTYAVMERFSTCD